MLKRTSEPRIWNRRILELYRRRRRNGVGMPRRLILKSQADGIVSRMPCPIAYRRIRPHLRSWRPHPIPIAGIRIGGCIGIGLLAGNDSPITRRFRGRCLNIPRLPGLLARILQNSRDIDALIEIQTPAGLSTECSRDRDLEESIPIHHTPPLSPEIRNQGTGMPRRFPWLPRIRLGGGYSLTESQRLQDVWIIHHRTPIRLGLMAYIVYSPGPRMRIFIFPMSSNDTRTGTPAGLQPGEAAGAGRLAGQRFAGSGSPPSEEEHPPPMGADAPRAGRAHGGGLRGLGPGEGQEIPARRRRVHERGDAGGLREGAAGGRGGFGEGLRAGYRLRLQVRMWTLRSSLARRKRGRRAWKRRPRRRYRYPLAGGGGAT